MGYNAGTGVATILMKYSPLLEKNINLCLEEIFTPTGKSIHLCLEEIFTPG